MIAVKTIAFGTASLIMLLASFGAFAQFDHQHKAWTNLLNKHVVVASGGNASRADYAGFARDRANLKGYLATLSSVSRRDFDNWSKSRQLAFLINAYNSHMVELILTRYPNIKSVWDFGRIFSNPFKMKFFNLLGREASLDLIEHEWIRSPGSYDDPRVHFAVNCASIGCPMLRNEAYIGDRLDLQLDEQTNRFLSDHTRNRYNAANDKLEVSAIFDWYGGDFTRGARGIASLEDFFATHANLLTEDAGARRRIAEKLAPLRFLDYDWQLNDTPR